MFRQVAFIAIVAATATSDARAGESVGGDALRSVIAGKTVHVSTSIGTVPVSFRADGTMIGRAGGLVSYAVAGTDHGRWWIAGDRLCSQWQQWFKGETKCVTLRREGQTLYWSGAGSSGTAMIAGGR